MLSYCVIVDVFGLWCTFNIILVSSTETSEYLQEAPDYNKHYDDVDDHISNLDHQDKTKESVSDKDDGKNVEIIRNDDEDTEGERSSMSNHQKSRSLK